ncbi:MAG: hypothetical protein ABSG71_13905 [Thermodesulfobacteriota bacterium]|jgi:hypothetical protein
MNAVKQVVPWKCHICYGEFDTPSGGICSRCNRATCHAHLYQIGKKLKLESEWVCYGCLTNEEKASKKNKFTVKLPNLPLKRTRKKLRVA